LKGAFVSAWGLAQDVYLDSIEQEKLYFCLQVMRKDIWKSRKFYSF
jgi:hypothetical protein